MDNLTHTLIGVAVAESGFSKKYGRAATWILAISSNLPDLDIALIFSHVHDAFLYRRTLTHSLFGAPILACAAAFLFKRIFKNLKTTTIFWLCCLGIGLHVFFDLCNSYGVVVLSPFSWRRFEFATLFIIDLAFWVLGILPLILLWFPPFKNSAPKKLLMWRICTAGIFLYTGVCFAARWQAQNILDQKLAESGHSVQMRYVFPEALGCQRFRGVVREGNTYDLYLIHILDGTAKLENTYETLAEDPEVKAIRESQRAQKLEWFFKAPVWQRDPADPRYFVVFDLRFFSTVLPRRDTFFNYRFPSREVQGLE